MSKHKIDLSEKVMGKIKTGEVKMRPKIYFIAGSALLFLGLVTSSVVAVFLFSLTRFLLRSHGPMAQYRLEQLLSSFPSWIPLLAVMSIIIGIMFLKKYDFSYRKNFIYVIIGFIAVIITASWVIDSLGLDNIWLRRGPMRQMMQPYLKDEDTDNWRRQPRWIQE